MQLFRTSQKMLFICNICWIATLVFRMISLAHWPDMLIKTIVILGTLVALPLGILWYLAWVAFFLKQKIGMKEIPRWLFFVNLFFIPLMAFYRIAG